MNGWRVFAIALLIITILETLFICWAFVVGTNTIEKENTCSYNICENYGSYVYDDYTGLCYCYENGEVALSKYLG